MSGISDLGGLSTNSSQWHVPVVSQDEAATSLTPPSRRHRLPQMHRPARQALVPDEPEALETPPSMVAAEIGREIVRLVPHWYSAECGPNQYGIPIGAHSAQFYNHCELTPSQSALLEKISEKTRELPLEYFTQMPGLIDVLLESIAIEWLRIHSNAVDWTKIIKYLEALARRTYENVPVALNLIIRPGRGTQDITEPRFQKFLDRLASSPLTYFAVDSELRLIEFGEVDWAQLRRVPSYKFHPDALHPIYGIMGDDDLSAHLTPQGDIIVMNKSGLLAARHKRRWKLYEIETLKDSFTRWLKSDCVGANLFEVVLDLSMRRMGALFVYDPEHRIRERILNPESIIFSGLEGRCQRRELLRTIVDRAFDREHRDWRGAGFSEKQAAADRTGLRRWRRRVRRQPPSGRGGADPIPPERWQSTGGQDDGGSFRLSLGSASDQGELGRRRDLVLPERQRPGSMRRGHALPVRS